MSRMTHSFSFWALVTFIVLYVLQLFPIPGIFLMILGGPFWCGLAAQVFLVALLFEAASGRLPRFLVIVPLAAYGFYYVMYAKQSVEIAAEARDMQASNPAEVLRFDPATYSLVMHSTESLSLAEFYDVPAVYQVDANLKPEGYRSHRLLDREQCARARDALARMKDRAAGFIIGVWSEGLVGGVCVLTFPDTPLLQQIVVTRRGDEAWSRKRTIMEQYTDFSLNGRVFATYKTASVWRLPVFPILVIGCGLNSGNPSWDCVADFYRSHEEIDGTPKGVDKAVYDSPESIVLGLRKYARSDYAGFKGNGSSSALIERIELYPQEQAEFRRQENARLFAQFVDFVHDTGTETTGKGVFIDLLYKGTTAPPAEMKAAILEKPEQLVPLRDAIAARFIQILNVLVGPNNVHVSPNSQWLRLLDRSLIALPRDSYVTMPDQEVTQILDALASDRGWDYYHSLYVRMADAGPRTLGFYEEQLAQLQDRGRDALPPVLAICRIGEASEQTKSILRKKFVESANSKFGGSDDVVRTNSTILVTLLKLHDPLVVDGYPTNFTREDVIGWYDAVRQGKGETDIGPNNCEGWTSFQPTSEPSALQAGLVYRNKSWIETRAK